MHENSCIQCQHFRQHYTFDNRKIFRVYCGHCTYKSAKHKKPDATACGNYTPRPPQEEVFVTKEYLTKELLQYMLTLELLPEIETDG